MAVPLRLPMRLYASASFGAFKKIGANYISLTAAGVAFFGMLSLFPALAALIAILSLIADPDVVVLQLEELRTLMPEDVYEILNAQIVALVSTSSNRLGWAGLLSILLAWWSARAGVGAMMHGLNVVYGLQSRASWRHYLRALMLTAALVAVGIVALLTVVVAPIALALLPFGNLVSFLLDALRWVIGVAVIFGGIGLLYRFGPNRSGISIGWLTPGALFSGVAWVVVSVAFSYYVAQFGNYNEVYGSIGAVMAMLMWLWISSFVVLIGASLNAELEDQLATAAARTSNADQTTDTDSTNPVGVQDVISD
ncbi:MAG: YihY/virulence factor BrkB family protein [Roseobacter sp.]